MAGDAGLAAVDHRDASLPALKKRNKAGIIKMIEHAVGIYIGLLLLACLVAIVSKMVTHLPYTIFLTLVGLLIGALGNSPSKPEPFYRPPDLLVIDEGLILVAVKRPRAL